MNQSRDAINWLINIQKSGAQNLAERFTYAHEVLVKDLFFEPPGAKTVCPMNPYRLNDRLRIQKGVFLVPGTIDDTFVENLGALKGHADPDRVLKIVFPAHLLQESIQRLFEMNISRTNLFPGLDGFAQSLSVFHPAFISMSSS